DEKNLIEVQKALKNTNLAQGDFTGSAEYIKDGSFVYLDPPYRPLNKTSHFTSYSKDGFNDDSQKRLADFYREMDGRGAKLMLSNSDPKNQDEGDKFFDELYNGFNLERISAKRNINRDASRRGKINELVVRNYS
ncbi:MAG TPA: Dam family site-specific DNA-(adenine-N6)-methyltransferase, partial [Methanobacterium sp.]|nr:Dam family site-specific DNA-(adenine-N6)-methyltransferase [Methanobacterium sp.]